VLGDSGLRRGIAAPVGQELQQQWQPAGIAVDPSQEGLNRGAELLAVGAALADDRLNIAEPCSETIL